MHDSDIIALAEGLLAVALKVARVQMRHFADGVKAEAKADNSPVTVADRESEDIILEGLAKIAPDIPVVAEEEAAAGRFPVLGSTFFLVDPLDGTKPFLRREPNFTINIALIADRRPVFGLLYAPAIPDFYVTLGTGKAAAARLNPSSEPRTLADCRLELLRGRAVDTARISALTSQNHLNTETRALLDRYKVADRRAVSSSLKFGLLARGEADLYPRVGPTNEWDTAAGHAVLAAAGGNVFTLDGEPLLYGKPKFANPAFVAWARSPASGAGNIG